MNKFLIFLIIIIFSFVVVPYVSAQEDGASLTIYPQIGAFVEGSIFDVSVILNTGDNYVEAVNIDLKFDPKILQVVTPTKEFSIVSEWVSPPTYSNTGGVVSLRGKFYNRGINTSDGLISIIAFRAIKTGKTSIEFIDSSEVIRADDKKANILNSVNIASYSVLLPLAKGPRVFSGTHPDQNKWYKNNSPSFHWDKIKDSEGYSYLISRDQFGEPDNIVDTINTSQCCFEGLEDGVWYFHLRAKEGEAWGGATSFRVNIDNTPPRSFKPHLEIFTTVLNHSSLFHFDTIDLLSGLDYYEARIVDISNPENILYSGFIRTESPYKFDTGKKGAFKVVIRAFDKAGNHREEEVKIRVITSNFARIDGGFQLFGVFFPLWFVVVVLAFIVITVAGIIIWRIEKRKNVCNRLEKDIEKVEEKLDDIEKLEKEVDNTPTTRQRIKGAWRRLGDRIKKKNNIS